MLADAALGTHSGRAAWTSVNMAVNVGVSGRNRVNNPVVRGDIPIVSGLGNIILPIGALGRVAGIEAVGQNVISVHVDFVLGDHRRQEKAASSGLNSHGPRNIVRRGGRRGAG